MGLDFEDMREFGEFLIRANGIQIEVMRQAIQVEMKKRQEHEK